MTLQDFYKSQGAEERGWNAILTGGTIVGGIIPGFGEGMDFWVLFHPDSNWWERSLAGGSLLVNAVSLGMAPNF
ncbi:hypothetical protein DTL42_00465 [Bremerella cremea]|uniref:Uncharacterized protein n=1 Tax=Bremerella cremea TaxID=1031537 RepID=A0A368KXL0_9BACT|nr:hypothetical protein DTL42_00465 [Bremerella cremea]